jgi:hypothetical protein
MKRCFIGRREGFFKAHFIFFVALIACIDFDGKHAITGAADGQMKVKK